MAGEEALKKDLTPEEFLLFRDWIHKHSGMYLEDSRFDSLRISLVTRATRFGFTDYGDYFAVLSSDEQEFKELMNLVTINETSFFRFPAQFDALRDKVIPEILDGRPQGASKQFRVWSAGCSTGEEPYTISMTLLESAVEGLGHRLEVVGTDVSTQALDRARKAIYPRRNVVNLTQPQLRQWFEPFDDGYRPVTRVREICSFHFHNLIKEPYPLALMSSWDVIFCRNVTIYFRVESTRRVVDHFYDALNPGGYLFIGHSETLASISDRFEAVEIDGVFLYRKPHVKRALSFEQVVARKQGQAAAGPGAGGRRYARPHKEEPVAASGPSRVDQLLADAHRELEQAQAASALAYADEALVLEPSNVSAHLVAAFAYADLGRLDDAMSQAQTVLDTYPLTAAARYIQGVIHQQRGDVGQALTEYRRTLYIDSDFVLAHFAVANLQRQQGNLEEARRAYENTLRSLSDKPDGSWRAFLGGFQPGLLARTCERSLLECAKGIRDA